MNGDNIQLTGATNVPWLTPEKWATATPFEKVSHLSTELTTDQKLQLAEKWLREISDRTARLVNVLERLQEARQEMTR